MRTVHVRDTLRVYSYAMKGGQFVREARRRAGMTQRQLAVRAGVSQPTVARIESGAANPSFERVVELVRACGLDLVVHVVPLDEDAWTLAQQNLRRSPDERVSEMLAALRFAETGRRAMEERDG